jgi:hypothetical protein
VFFVDDNLIGNRAVAKALLRALIDYQARHRYKFHFGTEASINLAQDPELLALMRDANFGWVFVGIESPDPQTLKDARKTQNTREDVLESVRTIYAYGIDVLAGFIVGFDNDTLESFEHQYRFIMKSGIQAAMVGLLTALPRTPLYERLEREGRLRTEAGHTADNTKLATNVIPKRMSYDEMIGAYKRLYHRLLSDHGIAERIRNKLAHLGSPVYDGEYAPRQRVRIVLRLLCHGILPGGTKRLYHFLRTIPWRQPSKIPLAIVDWIAGLAMRDYVRRYFEHASTREQPLVARRLAAMRALLSEHVRAGRVALSAQASRIELSLKLDARGGRRLFAQLATHLDALLAVRGATLTLTIDRLLEREAAYLERLLARLARHGDRIFIVVNEQLRELVRIDSSRFNLVLTQAGS